MKILVVGDYEEKCLWGKWTAEMAAKLSDVDFILSLGDLSSYYLEFLTEKLNIPLVYVPGNHDIGYIDNPPKRCINADGKIIDLRLNSDNVVQLVRITGLGGSMRYKDGHYQYSEEEQQSRVEKLLYDLDNNKKIETPDVKILLTHAPCRGYGDMDDLAHRGFDCFNKLLERWKPQVHCYGHVHQEYNDYIVHTMEADGFNRLLNHPSGTHLINGCGYQFIIV